MIAEFYTAEELTERLMLVLKGFLPEIQILEPNQPLMINGHGMFKWGWKPNLTLVQSKLQLLNALTFALKSHYGTLYEFDIKKSELWFKKKRIVVE